MNPQQFFGIIIVLGIASIWYQIYSLKDKVYIAYTRQSKQRLIGLVRIRDNKVVVDRKEFIVVPDRAVDVWYKGGTLGWVGLGTWIKGYEFSWYSRYPHNPNDYTVTVVSPANARIMNNEQRMGSFLRAAQAQGSKKQGKLVEWLPWIAIGLVLAVAYYLNTQMGNQNNHIAAIENMMKTLIK